MGGVLRALVGRERRHLPRVGVNEGRFTLVHCRKLICESETDHICLSPRNSFESMSLSPSSCIGQLVPCRTVFSNVERPGSQDNIWDDLRNIYSTGPPQPEIWSLYFESWQGEAAFVAYQLITLKLAKMYRLIRNLHINQKIQEGVQDHKLRPGRSEFHRIKVLLSSCESSDSACSWIFP